MNGTIDTALDPISGQQIAPTDIHYSAVRLYYSLLPVYQPEFQKALDYYLHYTWHDYAVLLLQTAEFMNITVRPPGFKSAPIPPMAHKVTLTPSYTIQVTESPVCATPPDPDPATQVLSVTRGADGSDVYNIVPLTPAGKGSGGLIVPPASTGTLSVAQLVVILKALPPDQLTALLTQVFGG